MQLQQRAIEPELTVRTVPKEDAKAYLYAKLSAAQGLAAAAGRGVAVPRRHVRRHGPAAAAVARRGARARLRRRRPGARAPRHRSRRSAARPGSSRPRATDSRNYPHDGQEHARARHRARRATTRSRSRENQEIKVELIGQTAPTKQNVDDKRGVLAWETKLEPDQEQVIEFGYRVIVAGARSPSSTGAEAAAADTASAAPSAVLDGLAAGRICAIT